MSENQNKLEELLDEYFDLAFEQGREFACNGIKANRVRKEILGLFNLEPVKQESWLPIETAPKGKKIIVKYKNAYGNERTVFAKYIEKFTEESTCDTECETDYSEDDDTFYLKEGWVELVENWDEFSSVYFDSANIPTGWMPAPLVEAQP